MTIETINRLLDAEPPPHNQRERRLIAALRAALTGLGNANSRTSYVTQATMDIEEAIDAIERELQG